MGSVFVHPGAWSSCAELNFVKTQIAANAQPWRQQLNNCIGQAGNGSSGRIFNGTTFNACTDEGAGQTDSALCYSNALAWYLTGTTSYYTKAMTILANYATMTGIVATGGCWTEQNKLDASWFGVLFANACELLRTSPSWTAANTTTYTNMFKNAFYPVLNTMCTGNGNIDLTQIDAMLSMAVFCDDLTEWNNAITRYKARMPAYFYADTWPEYNNPTNPDPGLNQPPHIAGDTGNGGTFPMGWWFNPTQWLHGLQQETCRDNGHHVQFALDAAIQSAEIDYHQGSRDNLYATHQIYLFPAMELLAQQFVTNTAMGTCAGAWDPQNQKLDTFEIGFNHYANRMGMGTANGTGLYYTNQWLTTLRANTSTTWIQFNIAWETLNHAGVY